MGGSFNNIQGAIRRVDALDRRNMLKAVGTTVAVGMLPGCMDANSPTAVDAVTAEGSNALGLAVLQADALDEYGLMQQATRFLSDAMADAEAGRRGRSADYLNRADQLFQRGQKLLRDDHPVGLTYRYQHDRIPKGKYREIVVDLNVRPFERHAFERELQECRAAQGLSGQEMSAEALSRAAIFSIVLAALGVGSYYTVIIGLIPDSYLTNLESAVKARRWSAAKTQLGYILNLLRSKEFYADLITAVGITAALNILIRIASRFIPFFGWALLIGSIIVEIVDLAIN